MRFRFAVLAAALSALVVAIAPAVSSAAPRHNHRLTINAAPNPIDAGDGVLIYGQLNKPPLNDQTIILWHHINGGASGFSRVSSTTTNPFGVYYFTRADGVVLTNREWFVTLAGKPGVHSRTIKEYVRALVGINASTMTGTTNHAVVFYGHVTPNHAGERVLLQEEQGSSDDWTTLKSDRLGPFSNYAISYKWKFAGTHDVRVVFPGDYRNLAGYSDAVTVTIQQAQVPDFTITTSKAIVPEGTGATISGVLDMPGTSTPEPKTSVTLYGKTADQSHFIALGSMPTGTNGGYGFNVTPTVNTVYQVRTTLAPHRHTAELYEGVQDVVMMTPSSPTSTVGGVVTFNGTVNPDKAGHWVYLQRFGVDGDWHSVEAVRVSATSAFHFIWRFGEAGVHKFRARIYGDEHNIGAASAPVTIDVAATPAPLSSLPPTS